MTTTSSPNQRRSSTLLNDVVLFVISAAVFSTLLSIFGPTLAIVERQHAAVTELRKVPGPVKVASQPKEERPVLGAQQKALDVEADVMELDHEEIFQATIKSCLPSDNAKQKNKKQKCGQYIPEPLGEDSKKIQRIALLAPPGDISNSLVNLVEKIMDQHNHRQNKVELDMDVIETSHVPPYGYGKTHGLTKVLRLVPQPLVLEVTDSLQSLLKPGETHAIITLEDMKAGLRQIIRFHCRLSHLAAHTAIMSVGFEDLLMEPADVTNKLHTFLVPKDVPEKHQGGGGDDDDMQFAPDDDQNGLFEAEEAYGTQILSHIQSAAQVDVNQALDQVLLEEMRLTKNLTKWPCQSFWTSGEASDPTKLSPLLQRLAAALSPDCDSPYANCWVERDKCEANGDGPCKKK